MRAKVFLAVALIVVPAIAETPDFENLRHNQTVTLIVPGAQCEAKVVSRQPDQLTLSLKKTTSACGQRNSRVTLSREDTWDIRDERSPTSRPNRKHLLKI